MGGLVIILLKGLINIMSRCRENFMKINNKGFTLVELLAVIVILALLITVAVPNVIKYFSSGNETLTKGAMEDLGDAALTASTEKFIKKCSDGKEYKDMTQEEISSCSITYTVQELIDQGYFRDDSKYCKRDAKVYVYRYTKASASGTKETDGIDEKKYYVEDGACVVSK